VLALLALAPFFAAAHQYWSVQRFVDGAAGVADTIVSVRISKSKSKVGVSYTYFPTFSYRVRGKTYREETSSFSADAWDQVGQTRDLFVGLENPEQFEIAEFGAMYWPVMAFSMRCWRSATVLALNILRSQGNAPCVPAFGPAAT
jgi:hypothetical protein